MQDAVMNQEAEVVVMQCPSHFHPFMFTLITAVFCLCVFVFGGGCCTSISMSASSLH